MTLAILGEQLRRILHTRGLAAWAGTDRLSSLPALVPGLAAREATPAAAIYSLLIAGAELPQARLAAGELEQLAAHGLVELAGRSARANVAILPLGCALVVCDRLDTPAEPDLVCWPDDSSYHLALSVPRARVATWLDLGTGSACAPLFAAHLAARIVGSDINPRATRYARLGADLSGVHALETIDSDLDAALPHELRAGCQLVTCNAPIPDGDPRGPRWRSADPALMARLVATARAFVAPGGTVVIHASADELCAALAEAAGDCTVVTYTPADAARGFAVAWWCPDAPSRRTAGRRLLTPERPHLTHEDR